MVIYFVIIKHKLNRSFERDKEGSDSHFHLQEGFYFNSVYLSDKKFKTVDKNMLKLKMEFYRDRIMDFE